jgi:hypothetical protein
MQFTLVDFFESDGASHREAVGEISLRQATGRRIRRLTGSRLQDGLPDKWLGAIKSAEGSQRLTSTNEKEHLHAQNEDQEQR